MSYRTLLAACAALALGAAGPASAGTATSSGAWNDTATWGGAAVPSSADDVIIGSGVTVTVPPGFAAGCNNLTLSPGSGSALIWLEDTSSSLTAGSVRVEQSTASSMTSLIDVGNGAFTAGSLTLGNASATNGSSRHTGLLISTGHATISGGLTTYSDAARIIFSDEGTLNLGGSVTQYGSNGAAGGKMTFTASTGTVTYDGSDAQTVAGLSYHNLTLDGGSAKIMGAGVNVVGRLAIAPTGSAIAQLADGTNLSIRELAFGTTGQVKGTWGSTAATTASNQSDIYFDATTDGMLSVTLDTSASANDLLSFGWDTYIGLIDEDSQTVKLYVPLTTDLTQVYPTCIVSKGANVLPASDGYAGFTSSNQTVTYTITAQDFSTKTYQVTVEPTAVLWSDNFDVADTTNLDRSTTAGRLSGTLAGSVSLKSAWAQQTIAGGQLSMVKPDGPTGRVRFHDSTGGWRNWAAEPEGEQILAVGGIRVEFDWTTIDATTDDWIAFNIGHSGFSAGEPGYRITDTTTDYGILLRGRGATHRFDNGAAVAAGSFATGLAAKHVVLDFFFTSLDDGSQVTARVTVDDTSLDHYAFTWSDNFGSLYMELETLMTGMKIDNYTVSTLPGAEMMTPSLAGKNFVYDPANRAFSLTLPYGTDVTDLAPTYTLSGGATCDKPSGSSQDFTNPVIYTVTSVDSNTTNAYTLTVKVLPMPPGGTAPVLWLDASQLEGLSDGQQVDLWTDVSGLWNHAARTEGSPVYKSAVINGKPVVRFDSGSFRFNRISTIRSVFWVVKEDAGASGPRHLLGDSDNADFHREGGDNGPLWSASWGRDRIYNGTTRLMGTTVDGVTTSLPADSFQLISLLTTGNGKANTVTNDRVYGRGWQGDIAEILIYDVPLSAVEEVEIGSYLTAKYGLTTAYPAFAPAANIYRFGLAGVPFTPDQENKTVTLFVPYGTDVTDLAPTYTLSAGATCDKASGSSQDFTHPVTYTVTARDGIGSNNYQVSVAVSAWSHAAWTGDADSGISNVYEYTAAVNCNDSAVTVNDVFFEADALTGMNFSVGGDVNRHVGGSNVTGDSKTLADKFIYGGNRTVTLTHLTPGVRYLTTFFGYGFDASEAVRVIVFAAGVDALLVPQNTYGLLNGIRISHEFTADASGTKVFSITPTGGDSFHMSAFANRTLNPVISNPFQTWAGVGGAAFSALNGEGLANGLAWLLGAAGPSAGNTLASLPTSAHGSNGLTLHFQRVHDTGTAKLYLEYSSDLSTWNAPGVLVPADLDGTGTLGTDIGYEVTRGSAIDEITLTIPNAHAATGRLFVRLAATEN